MARGAFDRAAGQAADQTGFRLGLVGAGRMGRTHLRAISGSALVTVTAVAEPFEQARQNLATSGLALYPSLGEMLDGADLDGVLIAAPSDQHVQIIGEVAARGLPILCEKPCGLTSAQASAAAQTAAAAGVPLQVAYWRRYVPALQAARDRIAAGDVGQLHLVTCSQWDESPPAAAFRAHSGGITIDMGVHEFDQLRWLTGQDITGIQAVAAELISDPDVAGDVASAQIIVALSGGATGFASLYGMRQIRAEHPTHPTRRNGGRLAREWGTERASPTRSPTCWRGGRMRRGSPASAKPRRYRRYATPWSSQPPRPDGWRSAR